MDSRLPGSSVHGIFQARILEWVAIKCVYAYNKFVIKLRWLDGHEFEPAPGVGDGQGSLACCNTWGRKQFDRTEGLK